MKKRYIIPAMQMTRIAQTLPICGSLSPSSATFYEEDATGDAMVKGQAGGQNYNVWDDDWSK